MDELEYFLSRTEEEPAKPKDNIKKKFGITFVLCLIADLMSSFDSYAMTHDWVITQIATGLLAQSIWFGASIFIYEAKSRRERFILFAGTALGCSLGSTFMLTLFKPLFTSIFP